MTEKLYYRDSYTIDFKANVVEVKSFNGKEAVILDKTYFYPTSGGQEHDTGYINGIKVVDVIEDENGEVLHIVDGNFASLGEVECKIDWDRRFSNMQQHTGQHILSRAFEILFSYETVSSRLGDDVGTVDLKADSLNYEKIHEVEFLANRIVWENRDVRIHFVSDSEVSKFPLRKPPKVSGIVRIIEVKDFDFSPCGGTHVSRSGEIGLIKIKGWERVKGELIRVGFVCGIRALKDYQIKNKVSSELIGLLSVRDFELFEQVSKILESQKEKQRMINYLTERLAEFEAEKFVQSAQRINDTKFVALSFEDRDIDWLKFLVKNLIKYPKVVAFVGSKINSANFIIARSEDVEVDLREILKEILSEMSVRGGGKADFVQFGAQIEKFDEIFRRGVEKLKIKLS